MAEYYCYVETANSSMVSSLQLWPFQETAAAEKLRKFQETAAAVKLWEFQETAGVERCTLWQLKETANVLKL